MWKKILSSKNFDFFSEWLNRLNALRYSRRVSSLRNTISGSWKLIHSGSLFLQTAIDFNTLISWRASNIKKFSLKFSYSGERKPPFPFAMTTTYLGTSVNFIDGTQSAKPLANFGGKVPPKIHTGFLDKKPF